MTETKPRLSADDWLRAGLKALSTSGPESLKAEPLARAMGTTKGSFYWHFQDVAAFHSRLVAYWEQAAVGALARAANASATPTDRLQHLAEITAESEAGQAAEAAIRAWARSFHTAANAVAEVDAARLAYARSVLDALGLTNPEFARLLYGAHLGMQALPGTAGENDSALSTLTAALLALQEA